MAPLVPVNQLGGRGERVKSVGPPASGQIQLILGPMFSGNIPVNKYLLSLVDNA